MIRALVCVAALICAAPAFAQNPPEGGEEIWDLSDPNAPRHWHTGLTCWQEAGETPFRTRTAYNPAGSDVSCAYLRNEDAVTLYATQRAPDESIAEVIRATREQVRGRYRGVQPAVDGRRTIQTSAGPLEVDELVFVVQGEDTQHQSRMRGASGVWHADVGGWTLKLRLSSFTSTNTSALQVLADALLGRAYAEMQTARDCTGAGLAVAPNLRVSDEETMAMQLGVSTLVHTMSAQLPMTPVAARRAGFVCLGEWRVHQDGTAFVGVMPARAPEASPLGAILLGFGEARPTEGAARMVALFDVSMNPFGVEGARTDRGHFVIGLAPRRTDFFGVLNDGEVRRTLSFVAEHATRTAPNFTLTESSGTD